MNLFPLSLAPILIHRNMDSVEDSAKPIGHNEVGEDTVMCIADESKAQGPTLSHPKQKRISPECDADGNPMVKKKRGGRKPEENSTELMSHDRYKNVSGETKTQRRTRMKKITGYWATKWFNFQMVHPRCAKRFAFTPPWGDCHTLLSLMENDTDQSPPPPHNPNPSSLMEQMYNPREVACRVINAERHERKKQKDKLKEKKNIEPTRQDVQKCKELSLDEGPSKRKHDKK